MLRKFSSIVSIYLAICLLGPFSSYGQKRGIDSSNYTSGKLHLQTVYDSTCKCDHVTEYYESGKLLSVKKYVHTGSLGIDTRIDGEEYRYFENGKIAIYTSWNNGAPEGRMYGNYPNGELAYERFFLSGYKDGTWTTYAEDGTIREQLIFSGKKTLWNTNDDNAQQKYFRNNKLTHIVELVDGKRSKLQIIDAVNYGEWMKENAITGKKLFISECSMCHSADNDIVGPKIGGVATRRSYDWLKKMITNGQALIKSGDKDAVELYEKWYRSEHPNFERLSTDEVNKLIDYLGTLK